MAVKAPQASPGRRPASPWGHGRRDRVALEEPCPRGVSWGRLGGEGAAGSSDVCQEDGAGPGVMRPGSSSMAMGFGSASRWRQGVWAKVARHWVVHEAVTVGRNGPGAIALSGVQLVWPLRLGAIDQTAVQSESPAETTAGTNPNRIYDPCHKSEYPT
jgi:hypothetical protein